MMYKIEDTSKMYGRKVYGKSRVDECPFCGKQSVTKNKQGVPVCEDHRNAVMNDMKCACGSWLEIKQGKFGYFFLCINCGCLSPSKVFEFNKVEDVSKGVKKSESSGSSKKNNGFIGYKKNNFKKENIDNFRKREPKVIVVRADDPFYTS